MAGQHVIILFLLFFSSFSRSQFLDLCLSVHVLTFQLCNDVFLLLMKSRNWIVDSTSSSSSVFSLVHVFVRYTLTTPGLYHVGLMFAVRCSILYFLFFFKKKEPRLLNTSLHRVCRAVLASVLVKSWSCWIWCFFYWDTLNVIFTTNSLWVSFYFFLILS